MSGPTLSCLPADVSNIISKTKQDVWSPPVFTYILLPYFDFVHGVAAFYRTCVSINAVCHCFNKLSSICLFDCSRRKPSESRKNDAVVVLVTKRLTLSDTAWSDGSVTSD